MSVSTPGAAGHGELERSLPESGSRCVTSQELRPTDTCYLRKMRSQIEKGALFEELHGRDRAFILPNPWDVGTARLLARMGFDALATTSAGFAFAMGRPDYA